MRVFEPGHPLVGLVAGREPGLDEPARLILAAEWWDLYMTHFANMGSVAAEAKEQLRGGERLVITAAWFYDQLLRRNCALILGTFPEVRQRINNELNENKLDREPADKLFDYLIALGQ
jgi:hypothetical protein